MLPSLGDLFAVGSVEKGKCYGVVRTTMLSLVKTKRKQIFYIQIIGKGDKNKMKEGNGEVKPYYKVLDGKGRSCNGGIAGWSLPLKREDGTWQPGKWMDKIDGELRPCVNGYHLCRPKDLVQWLGERLYEAEYKGELKEDDDKVVVRECRLLKSCESWTEETARAFACWCVRNTPLKDGRTVWALLRDDRSKKAVETAERYAKGEATKEELRLARDAAWAAAWAAAWGAAGADTWGAARADTWAAARTAAWAAAAADTWDAAWGAARTAAWAAAGVAVRDAARAAQTKELIRILHQTANRNGEKTDIKKGKRTL